MKAAGNTVLIITSGSSDIFQMLRLMARLQVSRWYRATQSCGRTTTTGVKEHQGTVPLGFSLHQNYPNPFNPTTTITYDVPKTSNVKIEVYNILGERVATLVNEMRTPGEYGVTLNGTKFSSGVYLYRMSAGNFVSVRKFVLVK